MIRLMLTDEQAQALRALLRQTVEAARDADVELTDVEEVNADLADLMAGVPPPSQQRD